MSEEVQTLPVLPLKNAVLFPNLVLPLTVGRATSMAAVEAALDGEDKCILVVAQRNAEEEDPGFEGLYDVGTRGVIRKMNRSENSMQLVVQGMERVVIEGQEGDAPPLRARVRTMPEPSDEGTAIEALHGAVLDQAKRLFELVHPQGEAAIEQLRKEVHDPLHQVYLLASLMTLDVEKEQSLLAAATRMEALERLHDYLTHEAQVTELRQQISNAAKSEMSKQQREYVLRQQLKAIQQELGESSPEESEAAELRDRLEKAELPEAVRKEAERELGRLERLPAAAPDYQLTRAYLELVVELPWMKRTEDVIDLARAREVLDEDHYDLDDVKERIIEHLAVLKLNPGARSPILCFVGPPGVGKTSLGQSIARALGRKFERMSLGGLHDEAELRGHRRTYIGAMPGRMIQAVRRAGVSNPLLMLDELDKLGRDFRGDPASAMLEILDPAQNHEFRDNYLNLPFDLSRVFFIATANTLDTIPLPLLDRMELLRLSGYSDEEKAHIARRYLIGRQRSEAGLAEEQLVIPDETVMRIIHGYTREAGVRELERVLGRVGRKVAVRFASGKTEPVTVRPDDLTEMLGPERFFEEEARKELAPGVATGLAWTPVGGDVLYIEAVLIPGTKELTLTGQLGDVMRESARAAWSYLRSQKGNGAGERARMDEGGIHIHVPAGAIPKDGPSAGVTMATAIASLYAGQPMRSDTAMTGEITLSGLVLPVGGVKEKVLAAHRAGLKRVILPRRNLQDLRDLTPRVREALEFIPADRIEDVLAAAIPEFEMAGAAAKAERLERHG